MKSRLVRPYPARWRARFGAIALAVGSLLAMIGMDRIGLVSPGSNSLFKTLALVGISLNGLGWIVLGLDVARGPRRTPLSNSAQPV